MMRRDYEVSLHELMESKGLTVADVYGIVSMEFGEPSFLITRVMLSDGRYIKVEGEHDHPYLCDTDEFFTLADPDEGE